MSTKDNTAAIVLGLSPTGLYAVRELGKAGVPVLGVSSYKQSGNYSGYLKDGLGTIVENDERRRLDILMDRFSNSKCKPVLIPTSDQDLDFILRHLPVLSDQFVFQASYTDGTGQIILDKSSFYELCRKNEIDVPGSWQAQRDQVDALAPEISFPCLVKPSLIHEVKRSMGGQKGWVARDRSAFIDIASALPVGNTDWLVQEIVPGPESDITLYAAYFDDSSQPHQAFTARKLRQFPPGFGSASLVASTAEEDTRRLTERLLAAMGYRGIAASEFKRDPRDGRLKIIEINPRPSLWFAVSTAANKRITLAAYHDLAGTGEKLAEVDQRQNVGWRYGVKDVYSAMFYRFNPGFVLPAPNVGVLGRLSPVVGAVWSIADPWPAFGDLWNFCEKAFGRIFRRNSTTQAR